MPVFRQLTSPEITDRQPTKLSRKLYPIASSQRFWPPTVPANKPQVVAFNQLGLPALPDKKSPRIGSFSKPTEKQAYMEPLI